MAYTDFRGLAVVMQRGPAFRAASTEALKVGDLVSREFAKADATAAGGSAHYVCLENVASGSSGLFAEWAVLRKPTTVGAGGATTEGSHSGTLGDTLWLSTTDGAAAEVIAGDGIYQVVGLVISTQDVLLKPSHATGDFFEFCEKETGAKTIDVNDSGKAIVCTSTSDIVVTLPTTAVGNHIIVVNGAQDGDHLVSISPNDSVADKIQGWDFSGTDDGDATNTKATSKAGDYLELVGDGADGWMVHSGRGVWAGA